jgi:hypothetical protein
MRKLPFLSVAKTWSIAKTWSVVKAGLAVLAFAVLLPIAAHADALDDARAAGLIGERPDGYVAAVSQNPAPDIQQLCDTINTQRRKVYDQLAAEKGVPVQEVAALAAEKTIGQRLKPGWIYMNNAGQWVKK